MSDPELETLRVEMETLMKQLYEASDTAERCLPLDEIRALLHHIDTVNDLSPYLLRSPKRIL
jgi:hypothetical protein